MDGYIAEIRMFAGNFAPRNWNYCDGSLISIASNTALFSLLGTTYGGNGQTTFGLPDLRGRVPVGTGQGPGLPYIALGEVSGTQTNTLLVTNLPPHNHSANASVTPAASTGGRGVTPTNVPTSNFPLQTDAGTNIYANTSNVAMGQSTVQVSIGVTGGGIPVNNMQPYLGMNYIICMYGMYPSRN